MLDVKRISHVRFLINQGSFLVGTGRLYSAEASRFFNCSTRVAYLASLSLAPFKSF